MRNKFRIMHWLRNCQDGSAIMRLRNRQFLLFLLFYAHKKPSPFFYTYLTKTSVNDKSSISSRSHINNTSQNRATRDFGSGKPTVVELHATVGLGRRLARLPAHSTIRPSKTWAWPRRFTVLL